MKIYTKAGDSGATRLHGGVRVWKNDLRVESYGSVDELNSVIGVARSIGLSKDVDALFATIQSALFRVGAELSCLPEHRSDLGLTLIGDDDVRSLESAIDRFTDELPPLTQFILPGGARTAAELHRARTTCRHAERQAVALSRQSKVSSTLLVYLNRLGDLLFVLARLENQRAGVPDVPWVTR